MNFCDFNLKYVLLHATRGHWSKVRVHLMKEHFPTFKKSHISVSLITQRMQRSFIRRPLSPFFLRCSHTSIFFSTFFCFSPSASSFFVCCDYDKAAVLRRQLHNCVCVCVCQPRANCETHTKGGQKERKGRGPKVSSFLTNFNLHFYFLCWCFRHLSSSSSYQAPLRPRPKPLHPSLHPQSYWAVKCEKLQHAWQFIILSNFPEPASSRGQIVREENRVRKEKRERERKQFMQWSLQQVNRLQRR